MIIAVLLNSNLDLLTKITNNSSDQYFESSDLWAKMGDIVAIGYDSILKEKSNDYEEGKGLLDNSKIPKGAEEKTLKKMKKYLEGKKENLTDSYPNLLFVVQDNNTGLIYSNDETLKEITQRGMKEEELEDYQFVSQVFLKKEEDYNLLKQKGFRYGNAYYLSYLESGEERSIADYVYENKNGELTLISEDDVNKYYEQKNQESEYDTEDGIVYDENGNEVDQSTMESTEEYDSNIENRDSYTLSYVYKTPKNITITAAIKKDLEFKDNISSSLSMYHERGIRNTAVEVFFIFAIIFALAALLLDYEYGQKVIFTRKFITIPLEVIAVIAGVVAYVFIIYILEIVPNIYAGNLPNVFNLSVFSEGAVHSIESSILLIGTSSIFFFAFTGGVYVKHIFKNGFFRYLKEHSLIIRGFRFVGRCFKGLFRPIARMNLHEEDQRRLFVLCVTNIVLSFIISCTWFFGIFLIIPYNIIIFLMIYRKWRKVKEQYDVLLKGTGQIASGKLDETITEDVGLFNPLRDDLAKIQEGFKVAVMEEVKSQNMKTELISNVSHDLKTPLTAIITYVDLLKNKELSLEEQQEYIAILDNKSQRLKGLIEDLFEMSKASTGNINFNFSELDIIWLLKEVLVDLESKFNDADLQVRYQLAEEKVMVCLDGHKTYRIFENLFVNITKYAMKHSRVYINEEVQEEYVVITIKNIAAEELNYNGSELLERFVRGDQSRNTEGSGLGLAIAKSLCEGQGGDLGVEVDGDLFKVKITFPILNINRSDKNSNLGTEKVDATIYSESEELKSEENVDKMKRTMAETDVEYKIEFSEEAYRIEDLLDIQSEKKE